MKNYYWIIIFMILSGGVKGQGLTDFEYLGDEYGANEKYLGIAVSYSGISNPAAPNPDKHNVKGITGELEFRRVNFAKGKSRIIYQQKLIGDLLLLLSELTKGNRGAYYRQVGSSITNGYLGWASFTWNLNTPKTVSVSAGFNLHDYLLGSTYEVDTTNNPGNRVSLEPQGYWFAAGPSIIADVYLSKHLILEASSSYSIGYWRAVSLEYAYADNDYPHPHFGQVNLELISAYGFYLGMDYNWLINRGNIPSKIRRLDFLLGFRFVL